MAGSWLQTQWTVVSGCGTLRRELLCMCCGSILRISSVLHGALMGACWRHALWIVRLWDAAKGKFKAVLQGHTDSLNTLAWSPDRRHFACASWDSGMRVREVSTCTCTCVLQPCRGGSRITSLAWSPCGGQLFVALNERQGGAMHIMSVTGYLRAE